MLQRHSSLEKSAKVRLKRGGKKRGEPQRLERGEAGERRDPRRVETGEAKERRKAKETEEKRSKKREIKKKIF